MLIRQPWFTVEGVTPDHKETAFFRVETDYVDALFESGQDDKGRACCILRDILKNPTSVFRGLCRPGDDPKYDEGLIYCGKPPTLLNEDGTPGKPWPGMVLAVYVVDTDDGQQAYDWDWREEAAGNPGHPSNWERDFKERLWPPTKPRR